MRRLPNILTLSRIVVIPILVWSFYVEGNLSNWIGFGFFALAGITDFFDGYLARSMGATSKLGQFLDPVADKLIVAATILLLVAFDRIVDFHILAAMVILSMRLRSETK